MKTDNRSNRIKSRMRLSALALVIVVLATCLTSCKPKLKNIDPKTVRGTVSPLNCASCESDLYLCDDTLFAFISRTLYEIKNNGSFRKIFYTSRISTGFFLGNGFFYYIDDQSLEQEDSFNSWILKRYDLKTGKTKTVASKIEKAYSFISRGNTIVLINYDDYYIVSDKEDGVEMLSYKGNYNEEYTLGNNKIMVEYDDSDTRLYKMEDDGSKVEMIMDNPPSLAINPPSIAMQLSDECLLVCRMPPDSTLSGSCRSRALAWIIDSESEIHELINPEGYAYFTGNYCNGYYYCSFYRYKELHKFYSEKFENDKLEGTWKVNVETFEQTKISDKIYDDIFVIGDKVIGVDSSCTFSLIDKG